MVKIGSYSIYAEMKNYHKAFGEKAEYIYIVRKCVGTKKTYDGGWIWENVAKFDTYKEAETYVREHEVKTNSIVEPVIEGEIISKVGGIEERERF